MKIIIHALGANMGGAIRHLHNFIPTLMQYDKIHQYVLILNNDIKYEFNDKSLQIVRISKTIGANFFLRTIFDVFYLPFLAVKLKADIVISLLNFGPVFYTKRHINFQRNSLYFCNYYLDNITGPEKLITRLRSALLYLTMKFAKTIITPSSSMIELIKIRYPSLKSKHFVTLYHGFKIENEERDSGWQKNLAEDSRFKILYPTHPAPHKGFELLFEAISRIKAVNNNFVLYTTIDYNDWPKVVGKYEEQIKESGIGDNVVFTGRIPQYEMPVLYKNCDLMIYPSLCESFGFSMVEAMGYGLPIVAADTPINKEICEDAALYYSALDADDSAKKILMSFNKSVRDDLIDKGKKRMTSYDWSWGRYTGEFLNIVENIT